MTQCDPNAYDEIPYEDHPFRDTHPRRLETLATVFGMEPPPLLTCRVLELGCAAGGNLIPQAQDLPDATFLGIDLSARQIADGQKTLGRLGLANIELRRADILDVNPSWGRFDYILCHGVFSYVPPHVQEAILRIFQKSLAPNGVAFVSYNVYPGWHARGMIRDMILQHVSDSATPREQLAQAKSLLDFLHGHVSDGSELARLLRAEVNLVRKHHDSYLYHEHLEEINRPLYFREFIERAEAAGLQYVCESSLSTMPSPALPEHLADALRGMPLIEQEQFLDFIRVNTFRKTLLCHAEVPLNRRLKPEMIERFHVSLSDKPALEEIVVNGPEEYSIEVGSGTINVRSPIVKAAVRRLMDVWPGAVGFDALYEAARGQLSPENEPASNQREILATSMLLAFCAGVVEWSVHPPSFARTPGRRPAVTPLVRLQASRGSAVTNRRHERVTLDDATRFVACRLDGRHDRTAVARDFQRLVASGALVLRKEQKPVESLDDGALSTLVDDALANISKLCLLVS